jgi:hypothetical protein
MQRRRIGLHAILILLLLSPRAPIASDQEQEREKAAGLPDVIWRDPGDATLLNPLYGAGGKEHAPDPNGTYTFVKEDLEGTSPKFEVKDAQGVRWRVKLGDEPQSETAASRLMWAAGYFVDEDYYLPKITVTSIPKLHRGQSFASADGSVRRAGLERHLTGLKKLGNWDWFANPFLGTRELNGLRVMMSLLNNWDLKIVNNSIYQAEGERRYLVSDLGASLGKTGGYFTRSKSVPNDYVHSNFIESTTPDLADFVLHSRGFNREYSRMEEITKHIPRTHAKWLGQRLSQLSEEQIRDCFRAAGYTPVEVEEYTKAVEKRVAELNAL